MLLLRDLYHDFFAQSLFYRTFELLWIGMLLILAGIGVIAAVTVYRLHIYDDEIEGGFYDV